MKLKGIILIGICAAAIVLPSCKKDKDDDSKAKPSLDGYLTLTSIPRYVGKSEPLSLLPKGITTQGTGYSWLSSWSSKRDTTRKEGGTGDGRFSFVSPKDIGTYTVSCTAFKSGYTPSSLSVTFRVIDPAVNTTVTGCGIQETDPSFKDSRDGTTYYTTEIAGKTWMKTNLSYAASGVSYQNSPAMDLLFGRFYTIEEALAACPPGWHLPSDAEFAAMASEIDGTRTFQSNDVFEGVAGGMMANALFLGSRMWSFWPEVSITNKSGFAAIPVGFAINMEGVDRFQGTNNYAAFWTSGSKDGQGIYRYIHVKQPNVMIAYGDRDSFRASVRCVKD